MSGLPVSHVGEKVSGGVISTGSPTVHVGSSAVGLADRVSACVPLVGKPVNPMLGSKLLPEEVDFALAAPDTFTFARGYLSSNPRIGRLGRGWWLPGESMHLELSEDACVLVDAQGRRIGFPALAPGAQHYSGSEELWLRRGGSSGGEAQAWRGRWAAVPAELQTQEGSVLVLSGHSYLHFQRCPDGIWRLQASFGRAGYRTEFRWSGRGLLTGVRDSAGRSYALVYQQACEPSEGDDGLRLFGVILASHDGPPPDYIDPQSPGLDWLVRYQFSDSGDLIAVRDRLGQVVRVFAWREHMLVAHGEPGGLEVRYEWDVHAPHGRVVKQIEAGGLTRTFRYLRDATEVSDSLGRVERYEFAGEGGQRRWTALVRADGSRSEFDYDLFGRLVAMRDPLGRETRRRLDGQGRMLEEESPGKARYRKRVDEETGLLVELEDAMQRRWTFERDERGNATTVRGPAGSTRYAYEDPRLPDRPTRIVDPRGGGLHRQFTQRGEVGLREERIDRRPRLFRHVDLALAQALQQLARRQVDEDDLVGLLQHPVRHRLADLHAGDVADLVVEALQVLDVDRCVDVDSRRQQLLDVLPALGVAAAGNVAVGQFVDQGQRRRVGEETVEVHFLQFHPSILEAAQRLLRHACEEGLGFRPRVGLDHPGAQFHALAQLGLGGLQHGEGLAHPRRRAEKDFQAAAPVSGQVGQQRVGACGVGHGSVVLRCSAPRRADDRRRSSADAAILQALAWVSGET